MIIYLIYPPENFYITRIFLPHLFIPFGTDIALYNKHQVVELYFNKIQHF